MTPQRYHILLALSGDDLHGSGIVRVVLENTDGELRLWPATLYGHLDSLTGERLIEELGAGQRPQESEKRRYYRITAKGARALADHTERMARLVKTARHNLRRRGAEEVP